MAFDRESFTDFLISSGVVGCFPEGRKLSSGRLSHWYANCRVLSDTARALEALAGFVLDFTDSLGLEYDFFFGVPEGGTKLGIMLNMLKAQRESNPGQPVVMGRGREKEHGDPRDRYVIGPLNSGDRIVVVEDVTTTGGSLFETVNRLRSMGAETEAAVALVNRLETREDGTGVEEAAEQSGFRYCAMSTAEDLIPLFIQRSSPAAEVIACIEDDFRKYGVRPLEL